jgi:hypothetical protein
VTHVTKGPSGLPHIASTICSFSMAPSNLVMPTAVMALSGTQRWREWSVLCVHLIGLRDAQIASKTLPLGVPVRISVD